MSAAAMTRHLGPTVTDSDEVLNSPRLIEPIEPECVESDFPLHCYPLEVQDVVEEYAKRNPNADKGALALAADAAISAAVGKRYQTEGHPSGRVQRGNDYFVMVAPSGTGKGDATALSKAIVEHEAECLEHWETKIKPRLEVEIEDLEKGSKDLAASQEDRIRAKEAITAKKEELSKRPLLIVGKVTGSALVGRMAGNNETVFFRAEEGADSLRTMLGLHNQGGKADADVALAAWSGQPVNSDTIGSGSRSLKDPCASGWWAVQPSIYKELCGNDEARERGMVARMLPYEVPERPHVPGPRYPEPVNDQPVKAYNQEVRRLLGSTENPDFRFTISYTAEALDAFYDFRASRITDLLNDKTIGEAGRSIVHRMEEHALRMALRWAAFENSDQITGDHAKRAIEVVDYLVTRMLERVGQAELRSQGVEAKKLAAMIERLEDKGEPTTVNNVRRQLNWDKEEVERVANAFSDWFQISEIQGKRGRPARIINLI